LISAATVVDSRVVVLVPSAADTVLGFVDLRSERLSFGSWWQEAYSVVVETAVLEVEGETDASDAGLLEVENVNKRRMDVPSTDDGDLDGVVVCHDVQLCNLDKSREG